jgi:protoheme IX farnesyltransferase
LVVAIIAGDASVIDYWRLMRPRIVAMVLVAMLVSAWTAVETPPDILKLLWAMCGTIGVIVGAIAFNQRIESRSDAKMERTADRPLPSGRLTPGQVTRFGVVSTLLGVCLLAAIGNWTLVLLAALSWTFYVMAYTPLKKRSMLQTPVGAVAGAMPVLLGAAAVDAPGSRLAWCLFGILFFWQFPHSMAIAWLYRREFAAAEVRVATVVDATGRMAGGIAMLGALLLLPIGMLPGFLANVRGGFSLVAAVLGLFYLAYSVHFAIAPNETTARRLLRCSLVYLPLVLLFLLCLRT